MSRHKSHAQRHPILRGERTCDTLRSELIPQPLTRLSVHSIKQPVPKLFSKNV